jgi:hypothetical protein
MTAPRARRRVAAAPLLICLVAVIAAGCAPKAPAPTGITFNAPAVGYVGKQLALTATAANRLPVSFSLDASSTGCSLNAGVLDFVAVGSCVVLADQPGDATNPALPQVRRTISVQDCPPLRSGRWTGPQGTSADVIAGGSTFSGTVDLTAFGAGVQEFAGTIDCDVARLEFNGTSLTGRLSPDGKRLSSSFQGISIVLNAPPE